VPVQDRCPGAVAPKIVTLETQTVGCDIAGSGGGPSSARGTAWLLSPGLYPAGITVDNRSIVYLLPGIYWIGGGGFQVSDDSTVISVASQAEAQSLYAVKDNTTQVKTLWTAGGGGVLLYNTTLPTSAAGPITLGGGGGQLLMKAFVAPATTPVDPREIFDNMSIFQDRTVTLRVTLNGSTADAEVAGIVYVPGGEAMVNGSASQFTLDQVIADTFKVNGSTGTIHVLKRVGVDAVITAAGLVD